MLSQNDKDLIANAIRWERSARSGVRHDPPPSEAERYAAEVLSEVGEGGDDQLAQLRLPGWQEAGGDYTHPTHGTVHINGDRWLHRKDNKIIKSGRGRTSFTEHLKAFATGDTGPAGTAGEGQHEVLRRALVGGPAPVRLQEGVHERLARALRGY